MDRCFGRRAVSMWSISTTSLSGTADRYSACKSPTPRASIKPQRGSGQETTTFSPDADKTTRSSATSVAPRTIISSARDDFPLPDVPITRTDRFPNATAVPCKTSCSASGMIAPKAAIRRQIARQGVQTSRPLRLDGYSRPRSRRHELRQFVSKWRVPTRNCCQNRFRDAVNKSV